MKRLILALALSSFSISALGLASVERIDLEFSDLPPSYYQLLRETDAPAACSIILPEAFDLESSYPAIVYFGGGPGGKGDQADYFLTAIEDEAFVLINITTFRNPEFYDKENRWQILEEDGPHSWTATRAILERIRTKVPQIDWESSVAVGVSNGGHLMSRWMNVPGFEAADWFKDFVFAESGRFYTGASHLPDNRRVLFVFGETFERFPENMSVAARAKESKPDQIEVLTMPNVGHEFPIRYRKRVVEWSSSGPE